MELVIVTGMSGAGKSSALRVFEDMGYHCIDNIPPSLMAQFADYCVSSGHPDKRAVLVVDSRSGNMDSFSDALDQLQQHNIVFHLLFLDCSDDILHHRYKECRRRHPLIQQTNGSVSAAIELERNQLLTARQRADIIIDTTYLDNRKLRERLHRIFCEDQQVMEISVISFGFKYGTPKDADFIFDVRCLPNPFYDVALRNLTGLDEPVFDYVFSSSEAVQYCNKILDMFEILLPMFVGEGKSNLVIAVGCTGGQHRSVAFAESIAAFCRKHGYFAGCVHRDIEKDREGYK